MPWIKAGGSCPSTISPTPSVFRQYPLETLIGVVEQFRGAVFLCVDMTPARIVRSRARTAPKKSKRAASQPARRARPIALYYWPTPNGWKVSIMLEECGLPYVVRPVDISKGEQFSPEFLAISPNNRMPAIVDPAGPGGRPISVFEIGRHPAISRPQDWKIYPRIARRGRQLANGRPWPDGGAGDPLPPLCARADCLRGRRAIPMRSIASTA